MPLSFLIINPPFAYRRAPGISWSNDPQLASDYSRLIVMAFSCRKKFHASRTGFYPINGVLGVPLQASVWKADGGIRSKECARR
jgi:hypothetical protein